MIILQALDQFITQLEADGRSPHTIAQYERHVRALADWAGAGSTLGAVGHQDVARFLGAPAARTRPDGGVKKANSVNALRSSLRGFFRFCHEVGWVKENPTRLVRRALCGKPLPRAIPDDDLAKLLGAITDPRDLMLVRFLVRTGIRIGSALALDVADLDLDRHEVLVRKAKGDRVERVYLPRDVAVELGKYLAGRTEGPVFTVRSGARMGPRHAHRRLAHWLRVAGITRPASPHSLRHSFATRLLAKTQDVALVQKALRHASITSTMVYAAMDDRRVREAIEA